MEVTFDRERANWPHNAPGRIYYEHVRNFVGEACFPGEWIVDGPKSLPLDLVFDFPYDLANATPAQVQWARRLLQMQKTGAGYKAADPSNTLTADEWRKAYNLALAANEFSRNENMPIIQACMMNDAVSQLLRIWCADGRVKAFLRNDNGSFSELPSYLWNTDRYKEWFNAGGYISAEHAFDAIGTKKDKSFPLFFSEVDLEQVAQTLPGANHGLRQGEPMRTGNGSNRVDTANDENGAASEPTIFKTYPATKPEMQTTLTMSQSWLAKHQHEHLTRTEAHIVLEKLHPRSTRDPRRTAMHGIVAAATIRRETGIKDKRTKILADLCRYLSSAKRH